MKIEQGKINRALKVLRLVKKGVAKLDLPEADVQTYHNGRENGFAIWNILAFADRVRDVVVTFAEYRNSDDIVIYYGDMQDAGEEVRDEVWASRTYSKSEEEAAQNIIQYFKKLAGEYRANKVAKVLEGSKV